MLASAARFRTLARMSIFSDSIHLIGKGKKRPYEIVAEAVEAWQAGKAARAEKLFGQGIEAYRRDEPDGLDFALGRCGAFYLDQGRVDDAEKMLKQAIELNTDIPAIWSDYVRIVAERQDIATFRSAAEKMSACLRDGVTAEFFLGHARAAARKGATAFAEQIAAWVVERSTRKADKEGRWAAIGDLGRIWERDGRLEDALKIWRQAFDEGSRDGETITRLCMQLEKLKEYGAAMQLIRTALNRTLPANLEESLRKRLVRCEEKAGPKGTPKKRAEVPSYSIRHDSPWFESAYQIRLKGSVADIVVVNNALRCLLSSKEVSTLLDFNIENGSETRRVENLPVLGSTHFAPDGRSIGERRTAAVGKGPTLLRFMSAEGRVVAESAVPDATSEIALGPDLWYVGCRNGFLYGFGFDGRQRWAWETPGARDSNDSPYFRPCPYYVSSQSSFAAVSSMGDVYAVAPDGRTLWHARLPNEHETKWDFTVPISGTQRCEEPYQVLGLSPKASSQEVKSAYRRLALATHPDRNPDDQDATANFRRVQQAYERILAGQAGGDTDFAGLTFSITMQGPGPLASFVNTSATSVLVGSSQGRIYSFDTHGRLQEARVLGDGQVRVALRADGSIGAAWCSDALLCFQGNKIINATESVEWPRDLTMWGDDIVLWRRNALQIMDSYGRLRYAVEFSKSVGSVVAQGDFLLCAAGPVVAFRRRS